ncbi:MAG: restriction endonuclease subunit S [Oscillospiraceae bacterium]|nr:restriction endonuclease subunit S [Oscillospiraceae bacterium]
MALTKCTLGEFIELREVTNDDLAFGSEDVRGVNNLKKLMLTKADINDRDLSKFQIVYPGEFVFNHRTSRNGSKFSIAYNDGQKPVICTEDYVVFRIKEDSKKDLLAEWLYMFFNRPEFDRYVITNSWGSSTEFYNWEDICAVEFLRPDYTIQKKYVDIYKAMVANQQSYEHGLEDLKLVCDGYIEDLRRKMPCEKIGPYIERHDVRNGRDGTKNVMGISTAKVFRKPTSKVNLDDLANYKIVKPRQLGFVQTTHNEKVFAYAFNDTNNDIAVSSVYEVFSTDEESLLPEYLALYFNRKEFDRYARFNSWGTARETFTWAELVDVRIPIPDIKLQHSIAEIYVAYNARKRINEQLKEQIKDICPILVKGALEEAQNGEV